MRLVTYSLIAIENHERYKFLSEGPNGAIKKVVQYQKIDEGIYNLSFGDWNESEQSIDDSIRTNNKDRDKVLATVASTIMDFMKYHPEAIIAAKGSTPARTRLYQIGIANNWHSIKEKFYVEGLYNGKWEPFKSGRNYQAFSLQAK